jgi:gluconokinase
VLSAGGDRAVSRAIDVGHVALVTRAGPKARRGPLVVAIDVGSSSIRAGLFDALGRPRRGSFAQVPYQMTLDPDGGAAVEVERLLEVLSATLDELVDRTGTALADLAGVGISCFLHSVAGLDAAGRPITPLLTWADTTSARQATELRQRLDQAALWQETGCPLHASYWPAKILRLRATSGGRARTFAGAPEVLLAELTGRRAIDVSQASGTGLLDRRTGTWHADLLRELELEPSALPEIVPAGTWARLDGWAAERWPSLGGIPWFVPWSDAVCGNAGVGCTVGRGAALQVGTSGAVRVVVADPVPPVPAGLFAHRLADGTALVGGQLSEGGAVAAAIASLVGGTPRALEAAARDLPPDGHRLTILPYLAGERGPGYDAQARGVISGLNLRTSSAELYLATLESIAFRFAALDTRLQELVGDPPEVVASGGALARSPLWVEILAAALGRTIQASSEGEASSRGAALHALAAAAVIGSTAEVPPPAARPVVPDAERAARYRAARDRQERLYQRMRSDPWPAFLD